MRFFQSLTSHWSVWIFACRPEVAVELIRNIRLAQRSWSGWKVEKTTGCHSSDTDTNSPHLVIFTWKRRCCRTQGECTSPSAPWMFSTFRTPSENTAKQRPGLTQAPQWSWVSVTVVSLQSGFSDCSKFSLRLYWSRTEKWISLIRKLHVGLFWSLWLLIFEQGSLKLKVFSSEFGNTYTHYLTAVVELLHTSE